MDAQLQHSAHGFSSDRSAEFCTFVKAAQYSRALDATSPLSLPSGAATEPSCQKVLGKSNSYWLPVCFLQIFMQESRAFHVTRHLQIILIFLVYSLE